ncbi:uncharacterized protein N7496_009086 [Penicillium cataractarum]|uniref:Integrase catalytic domain-containing protein n=1 Tax=Penicillium cataractarum TaxID=2100454 RepID=A0A9W9V7N5_9EURO|nr:uncharacterized protein N7496_009086 [Penicillium cataractarum]KAJ5369326.1 hypothetical protein N7496_009086 [Penicillium cataractarum]
MESTVISAMKGEKLKDPLQWRNWFARIKLYARQKRVWDLIDPHTEEGYLEEPIRKPRRPQYPEDGNESAKREWRDRMDIYKLDLNEWEQQNKSLDAINEWIISNLDAIHHTSMLNYQTPYERLVYLHTRFGRATAAEEDVRTQWKRVSALPPKKGADIDQWINEWDSLREQGVSLDLPEIKNANKDFLRAVKDLLPMWWQSKFEAIVLHQEEWDTRDLIENFRGTYREIHPQRSTVSTISKASFSTLQGFEEAKQEDQQQAQPLQPQQPRFLPPIPKRWCPCGNKVHKPWDCWVINREAFPDKPALRWKVKRVEERLSKDEAWKTWIEKMVKDHNEKNGVNDTTKMANSTQLWGSYFTSFPIKQVYQSVKAAGEDDTRKRWFLDTASSVHICNQRDLFTKLTPKQDGLKTGDSYTAVEGIGSAIMTGVGPDGSTRPIQLSNVLYSPDFHANLMSYAGLKKKGLKWDEDNECIKDSNGEPVINVRLNEALDIWAFDQPKEQILPEDLAHAHAHAVRTSEKPLVAEASVDRWHRRLAHVSKRVVKKAAEIVDGIKINEDLPDSTSEEEERELCQICNLASAPRQISRRPIGRSFGRYGRIHFDLVQFPPGYNNHQWMTHFYVEGIRFHWLYTHQFKWECRDAVRNFIALVKNWWNLPIRAFQYDNELSAGAETESFLSNIGIVVSHSIPYHPEQNGSAERSGSVILTMARHLQIESQLPQKLWPEMVSTAVWILNRIPTHLKEENHWIVPWNEARKDFGGERMKKASLANLRVYGSLTYCRIRHIPRLQKTSPRAEIGFLVGYVASNIWKVWFPAKGKVEIVRDARFDEARRWKPDMQYWQDIELPIPEPTILTDEEHLNVLREDLGMPAELSANRNTEEDRQQDHNEICHEDQAIHQRVCEVEEEDPDQGDPAEPTVETTAEPQGVVIPITPEPDSRDHLLVDHPLPVETLPGSFPIEEPTILPLSPPGDQITTVSPSAAGQGVDNQPISQATNQRSCLNEDQPPEPEIPPETLTGEVTEEDSLSDSEQQLHTELHTRRSDGIDTANILEGSRRRRPRVDPDYHAYATILTPLIENEPPELLRTFAAALYTEKPIQRHRDDLPPVPNGWREMMKHPMAEGFLAACAKEIRSLQEKSTFTVINRPRDVSKQILPLRWVFAYKFDQDGYLQKLKARICVRGDLETISPEDKRAVTLAARSARMIFALIAAFNLDLRQRDAVTAFLNSELPTETYTRMPEGFDRPGMCWKLQRALYGLRISPKLWQQEASRVLEKLGLTPIPEDPCVFVSQGIIVFFYVDDILIANHPSVREKAKQLEKDLEAHWELTDHGEAEWFLNIRIIRDRSEHKLWLCQDAYISSMAARYNLTDRPPVYTPLPVEEMKPYDSTATPAEVKLY